MGIGDKTARLAHDAFLEGLRDIAETVLEKAADNVGVGDPAVDPNPAIALAKSGHIEQHGDGVVVIFDTEYAARQHEDIHAKHPRGGHAKYLERAVTEVVPGMDAVIASKVEVRLNAGLPRESL
jgi:predicted secreted Zn-dependent protease